MASELQCPVCAKTLGPNPCLTCGGKGSVKWLIVLNSVCPTCYGEGSQVRCPDLESHLHTGAAVGPRPSASNLCPECLGAGFLRRFGGLGGGARCSTCGGKGLIDRSTPT
jgi:DnaJ-class molecular chaperone